MNFNIIGSKISKISRVCDLVSIQFSTCNKMIVTLNIQCFFRVLKNNKVLICSEDMYRCASAFEQESFEWDIPGKSVYDQTVKKHIKELTNLVVVDCKQNDSGDISIMFEDDNVLQIFVDTTMSEEKYRIFNDNDCFVVSIIGI